MDELPFDYQKDGDYYIELRDYDLNQDNFMPMLVFCFSIYKHGFEKTKGLISNNLAYTDPRDCLDAARWITYRYKQELEKYYTTESISQEDLKENIFRFNETDQSVPSIDPSLKISEIPLELLEEYLLDDIRVVKPKKHTKLEDRPRNFEYLKNKERFKIRKPKTRF